MNYNTEKSVRARVWTIIIAAVLAVAAGTWYAGRAAARAEARTITCWVMCKPGSQVNVRRTPDKKGQVVGFLEAGDDFRTTGESKHGFIRAEGIGEYGEAWIYCGFVVTEKPAEVYENYVCVSNQRVACRRWVDGPKVQGSPWITNGSTVSMFFMADGWACTSRGYIRSEWLEADPE